MSDTFPGADYYSISDLDIKLDELEARVLDPEDELDAEDMAELTALRELNTTSGSGLTVLRGNTLIHERYFTTYIKESVIESNSTINFRESPFAWIDWDLVAKDASSDYTIYEVGEHTYYSFE